MSDKPHIMIVEAKFYEDLAEELAKGATQALDQAGATYERVEVPGAFEIPLVADYLANETDVAAVVCLGAVIRGETTHDQHINRAVSLAIEDCARHSGVPVLFGLLTCDTLEQAIHRLAKRKQLPERRRTAHDGHRDTSS